MRSKKLKIAFLNKQLPSDSPNGVSVQVHRLANELSSRGHDLTVFTFSPKPTNALYSHTKLNSKAKSTIVKKFEAAFEFKKIKQEDFDIIHYHGDDFLSKGSHNRVRTFYGSALNEAIHAQSIGRFLYQGLFYFFEWISILKKGYTVGISKATQKALPLIKNVIHCGVPEEYFKPQNIKTNHPSILFIGDLNSRKRGSLLLNIFESIILPQIPDCTLSVVGPEKCHGENVKYLGQINDEELTKEYQKSWVYCMPSSYEGFGVPIIEAMACNTAVISTRNAATKEIIRNKINGIISTPKLFGKDVISVINDKILYNKIIKEGLNTFKQEFTIRKTADSYETLYFKILNKKDA